MAFSFINNNYAGKNAQRNNTSRNIPKDNFDSMVFNMNKQPKALKEYTKYEHDMKKEFKWTYTPPPR